MALFGAVMLGFLRGRRGNTGGGGGDICFPCPTRATQEGDGGSAQPAGVGNGHDAFLLSDHCVTLSCPLSSALEMEIQESNKALMSKSARLLGLEEQVGRIRDTINKRVAYYESCS